MSNCSPGDTVLVKINAGLIVNQYDPDYEQTQLLDIICLSDPGYLVYIPRDLHLTNSFIIDWEAIKEFKIPKQFIDGMFHFINDSHIVSIRRRLDGALCDSCNEWTPMASCNVGDVFICFLCRTYPYRSKTKKIT